MSGAAVDALLAGMRERKASGLCVGVAADLIGGVQGPCPNAAIVGGLNCAEHTIASRADVVRLERKLDAVLAALGVEAP